MTNNTFKKIGDDSLLKSIWWMIQVKRLGPPRKKPLWQLGDSVKDFENRAKKQFNCMVFLILSHRFHLLFCFNPFYFYLSLIFLKRVNKLFFFLSLFYVKINIHFIFLLFINCGVCRIWVLIGVVFVKVHSSSHTFMCICIT